MRFMLTRARSCARLIGVCLATAAVMAAVFCSGASASAPSTVTETAWVPLFCQLANLNLYLHVAATLTATSPASVTPGQSFDLTNVSSDVVVPPAAQKTAAIFTGVTAVAGTVSDFETHLVGETFGGASQINSVAALQPPNSDAPNPSDPLINGPSPLATFAANNLPAPTGVFSFGPIPIDPNNPTGNAYGPAPGTGGGPDVTSGTPDAFTLGPFVTTGAPGTDAIGQFENPNAANPNRLLPIVSNSIAFDASTGWLPPLPLTCLPDTSAQALPSPSASFVSQLSIPIVAAPPVVTTQPSDQTVIAGQTATFTAAASGDATVQWQVSSAPGQPFVDVSGATSTTLSVTAAAADNGAQYEAVFTNSSGTVTSQPATLTVQSPPTVTGNPVGETVQAGQSASFKAVASGSPAPSVQWQVEAPGASTFTAIPGATSTTLQVSNVTLAQSGSRYQAVFTNAVGTADSIPATLTVTPPPDLPQIQGVLPGRGHTFSLVVIFGSHLAAVTKVTFGSQPALFLPLGNSLIIALAPYEPAGTVDITATSKVGSSLPSAADQFTYGRTLGLW